MKQALPGNNLLPQADEKRNQARQNRYGLDGDNGYDQMVESQLPRDGSVGKQKESILNFTNNKQVSPRSKSVKSEKSKADSVDLEPVRQGKRSIVNQPAEKLTKKPA